MKRIVSLVLALSMVLSMFSMSFAGTGLKDIENTKYEAAVEALIELGVVSGYPDGTYMPDNVVTRAELAKLLVVAYGLEPAAEASKGVTPFDDVNSINHWASGYINVSADYKFVNGYPDGSFKGDETVTYAEAITMCLRVLGYANEIDSKGTWPTNYIAKAQDLKLMKDIDFKSYNDGAKRGDIALLIWNMLRTPMWEVTGESEGDGLQSNPNRLMLNIKFSDYKYEKEVIFNSFEVDFDSKAEETKVYVTAGDYTKYEYAKNDFYTFVPGTEVEILVDTENKEILTMVPNGEDKLVEGTKAEIDDKYDALSGESYDYVYAILEGRDAEKNVKLSGSSIFVDKIEKNTKKLYLTHGTTRVSFDIDDMDEMLVLKDGERVSLDVIKEGDILTTVTGASEVFYVIGGTEVEGELTKYPLDAKYDDGTTYPTIVVGGENYLVDGSTYYVVNPEKSTITEVALTLNNATEKMKGEVVTLKLDPVFGKVVRMEFDGKIDAGDDEASTWKIFAIESYVSSNDGSYSISLADAEGAEDYTFANVDLGRNLFIGDKAIKGYLAAVELDADNEIESIQFIAKSGANPVVEDTNSVTYGDINENEVYEFVAKESGLTYNEDYKSIEEGSTKIANVSDSVVVIRLVYDNKDTDKTSDDTYTVEFAEGLAELDDLTATEQVIVVLDKADEAGRAKYVVLFEEATDTSDLKFGVIESITTDGLDGEITVTLADGSSYIAKDGITKDMLDAYKAVAYKVETTADDKERFALVDGLKATDLTKANDEKHAYVSWVSDEGDLVNISGETEDTTFVGIEVAGKEMTDVLEAALGKDFKVVVATVALEEDSEEQYEVTSIVEVDYEELDLVLADRLSYGNELLCVIRSMPERTTTPAQPANPQ